MKLDCGPTLDELRCRRAQWHRCFAWWPTWVGPHDCRWLEWIERKGEWHDGNWAGGDYWSWEYRAIS
jgi:hypothetical protein